MRGAESLFEDPRPDPPRRADHPAVVVDDVTMVYRVTSTGGPDELRLPRAQRLLRRALGRPPQVDNRALSGVSLLIDRGESVGFVGRNGSGKSTLMNIVAGQLNPTRGRVWSTSRPAKLGVNVALVPGLSGERNIRLGCLAQGMTPRQVDAVFDELVEVAALGRAIHWPMTAYSSGMAARLRFAVATATHPDVLILDEALGTGDAQFAARGRARMGQIRQDAGCVLVVSHSMPELRSLCTRVVWIDAGEVVADGPAEETIGAYETYMAMLAAGNNLSARAFRDERRAAHPPLRLVRSP